MGTKTNMKPYNPLIWPAVPHDFTGDNNLGMYTEETTQRYIPGTRFLRWDGSVFKYGRLKGVSVLGRAVFNKSGVVNIAGSGPQTSDMVIGSRTMIFNLQASDGYEGGGVEEDELIGGYIFSSTTTRLIMGNTAAVHTTGTLIVTADAPYHKAATTPWTEIILNPYNYIAGSAANALSAAMGLPVIASTSGNYIWIQTYGPCGMLSTGNAGDANNQRSAYFASDGSIRDGSEVTIETGWQLAGYILDESSATGGCVPIIFLQISI